MLVDYVYSSFQKETKNAVERTEIIIILLRNLAIVALLNHVCLVGKAIHFAIMLHVSALKTRRLAFKVGRYAFKVSARK